MEVREHEKGQSDFFRNEEFMRMKKRDNKTYHIQIIIRKYYIETNATLVTNKQQ